ncbi:LuxR C-terminal-related transcriptional regulator [Amycolatopsis sp. cg13]|uniref:LuxR C-terminal-related transcriptional regulator n=1 Tax=Amycolatopsis sp. cg13 TaxID=3238807 RepID=UPI0035259132
MTVLAECPLEMTGTTDFCQLQRVLVVDENELIQAGLCAVLEAAPWVSACYMASTAKDAVQVIRRHQPQVVVVSASLRGRSSAELCCWIQDWMPHVKMVLMAGIGRVPTALATSLGAAGALSKHLPRGAIVSAIKSVAEGVRVFPKTDVTPENRLSRRELDVLQHLAAGLSNPETAASLNLSRHTVKQHTSAVYRKLGVRNRAEAASRAQELGLLVKVELSGGERLAS